MGRMQASAFDIPAPTGTGGVVGAGIGVVVGLAITLAIVRGRSFFSLGDVRSVNSRPPRRSVVLMAIVACGVLGAIGAYIGSAVG